MAESPEKPDQVAPLSQEGYQLLRDGRFNEAIERFERVLEIQPDNSYALVGLGDIARKQDRQHDAVDFYTKCLEHDPENAFALFGLADSYRSLRKYHDALRIWERYLAHDDRNVTVLTRVADAYRKVRGKRRSQELYRKVLEIEADNAYALIGLGHLHYDFREYEEALSYWTRMYELAGRGVDIRVLTSIGNSYRKLKEFSKGIPFFEQALEKEPENFYALFGLADCYRGLNEPERSIDYWNRILANDPDNKVILTRAGDARRSMNQLDEAETFYRKALQIDADMYASLGLAIIARNRGSYEKALDILEQLRTRDRDNYRIYVELAATHAQAGDLDEAMRVLVGFDSQGRGNAYVEDMIDRYRREAHRRE